MTYQIKAAVDGSILKFDRFLSILKVQIIITYISAHGEDSIGHKKDSNITVLLSFQTIFIYFYNI